MDAGTGIGIAPVLFAVREGGSVGVSGDEVSLVEFCPVCHAIFNDFTFAIISGGACGVFYSGQLKRSPDVPYQPSRQFPELIVEKIRLMAVYQIVSDAFVIGAGTFDNQGLG